MDYMKTRPAGQFKPVPHYSAEGDSLTFYFRQDESYAERIDDFLTVYKSLNTEELVGCQVKGLPDALRLLGNFGMNLYQGKKLKLSMIFLALMAQSDESESKKCYEKLGQIANEQDAQLDPNNVDDLIGV